MAVTSPMNFGNLGSTVAIDKLSSQLREYAKAQCTLTSIPRTISVKGGKGGQNIKVTRAGRLTQEYTTTPLAETARTPDATMPFDNVTLTLYEYGIAVQHTDLLEQLAEYDINNAIQRELAQWLAETRDALIFNQLVATFVKYAPTGTAGAGAGTWITDGTHATAATRNIDSADIVAIKNKLRDTYKAPRFPDGTYHFHAPATTLDCILRDSRIQATLIGAYQGARESAPTVNGQLVRWNGITFIEDNFAISPVTTPGFVGGGFMVADDAVAEATALAPRLYLDPSADGARFHRVVMRGTWGVKLLWGNDATDVANNQVRVIQVVGH